MPPEPTIWVDVEDFLPYFEFRASAVALSDRLTRADCIELVTFTWHLVPDGPLSAMDDDVHALASRATIAPAAATPHPKCRVRGNS